MIYREPALYEEVKTRLSQERGAVDLESPPFAFNLTDYYAAEMGAGLHRRFLSFAELGEPECLPALKLWTNALEERIRTERGLPGRPANIDPGYLTASALVMATTKDFSHRIPLGQGIYAHLEFLFTKGGVKVLDWTYPDFRTAPVQEFFLELRGRFLRAVRRTPPGR